LKHRRIDAGGTARLDDIVESKEQLAVALLTGLALNLIPQSLQTFLHVPDENRSLFRLLV
jgi:hypothetical protein